MLAEATTALAAVRNVHWLTRLIRGALSRMRSREVRVFDSLWWFYDNDPAAVPTSQHAGEARLWRGWRGDSVRMQSVRVRERTDPSKEVTRPYTASGHMRGSVLVLSWQAEGRPMTFGSIVLSISIDCDQMTGFTMYFNPTTNKVEPWPIWLRRAPTPT